MVKTTAGSEVGWLPVIAATVAFAACGPVPGAPIPDPQSADGPQLSLAATEAIAVIDPKLDIEPVVGRPGEPLTVCGLLVGGSEVRVVFSDPATGATWPEHVNEFVSADESGRWCWIGLVPTELQHHEPAAMGDLYRITDGIYEIRIESFGAADVRTAIEVTNADSSSEQPETNG